MEADDAAYIRFRLGNIDSYQGSPSDLDRGEFPRVPIIRIWGAADETGQKVCLLRCFQLTHGLGLLSCPWRLSVLLC